jgi:hypothetical protein
MLPWLRKPSGALIVALVALAYTAWLGVEWLPLPYTSFEMPLSTGRVWDMQQELARSGSFGWWTPTYMSGSSAVAQQNFLIFFPWAFLAPVFGLLATGKLISLACIGGSGLAMFYCARRLVGGSELVATVAALAYLLHSHVIQVTTYAEQPCITLFIAMLPLAWLAFARLLDRARFGDAFVCAVAFTLLLWSHAKLTSVQFPFLAAFAVWFLRRAPDRRVERVRALAITGGLSLLLAGPFIVPPLMEVKLFKLFERDPFESWQRFYCVHNLGTLASRVPGARNYFGLALLALVAVAMVWPKERSNRSLFWLLIGFEILAVALGHGPKTVGMAEVKALVGDHADWTEATYWTCDCGLFAGAACIGGVALRSQIKTFSARIGAVSALAAFWFLPLYNLFALVPLYSQIRAPEIFFGEPSAFFGSLLAGFFARDVLEPRLGGSLWRARGAVAFLAVAFFADTWALQGQTMASDLSPESVDRTRAMYARLGDEAKLEGGKVFNWNSSSLFLVGPTWGGPPLLTESGLNFGAPRGSGLLAAASYGSFELNRAYIELGGAHWVVYEMARGRADGHLAAYRSTFPLEFEDEDYAVFHVPAAHPYVSSYAHTALAFGDAPLMPELALRLSDAGYLLVNAKERIQDASPVDTAGYDTIYVPTYPESSLPSEIASKVVVMGDQPPLPPRAPRDEAIGDLVVTRERAGRIDASFTASSARIAVIGESYYPYWRATLDGSPAEVQRVAYGFMGVSVPEGRHDLVLDYEVPRAYPLSILVSVGTLLAAAAATWRGRLRRPA